jgi:DNA-binding CsgD family transcriptional regulator
MLVDDIARDALQSPRTLSNKTLRTVPKGPSDDVFSAQDLQILRWIIAGKTDRDIGTLMGLSAKTVNYHVEKMKQRLGVCTRVQLAVAALCVKLGLDCDACDVLSQVVG